MALHLIKLSVGSKGLDDLRRWQAQHGKAHPPLRHATRNFPRRAEEVLDGGSIYWVIDRILAARQRVLDIVEGQRQDGTRCTHLILDTTLVPVRGRLMRPFQGWRYLPDADAPPDLDGACDQADLPDALRRELAALALL